ncbi:MAG: LacI family DNA-binding transcriptional regulator [Candidatus Zhuqueibacterota bacterium]
MNKRKKATLKSIADTIGVTPATVSKALRDSSDISGEMRRKVKNLAQKMGYRPNLMARTLINKHSNLLGVIIPDLRISFISETTRGIYEQARKRGYVAILMVNDEEPENERRNLEFLSDLRVDGILLNPVSGKMNYAMYQELIEEEIPVVCYDRKLDCFDFQSVTIDDREAAFKLTTRLIQEGRKKIAYLGPNDGFSVAVERFQGYAAALTANGLAFDPKYVAATGLDIHDSYVATKNLLSRGLKIDAMVCIGGLVAFGAGQAVLESRLSIPEDVILAEFGDNNIVARLGVPFYTINQNPYIMGQTAVDLLLESIERRGATSAPRHVIIETQLIHRNIGDFRE